MSFVVTETYPASGNAPASSGDLAGIRDNWAAIETFFTTTKHYTFTSALSGQHIPGVAGLVYCTGNVPSRFTTASNIGAMAIDTLQGAVIRYNGVSVGTSYSNWGNITESCWSACIRSFYAASGTSGVLLNLALSGSTGLDKIDMLGEMDGVNNRYVCKNDGFYYVSVNASVGPYVYLYGPFEVYVYVNGSAAFMGCLRDYPWINTITRGSINIYDVIPLNTDDYVEVRVRHYNPNIYSYIQGTFSIVRLS